MSAAITRPEARRVEKTSRWVFYERAMRRVIIAALALLVILNAGALHRRVRFWMTGTVRVDGLVFHLNPADDCLTRHVLTDGYWEPEETRRICQQLRPGDTVVDVGANIGWYTVFASRAVGEDGLVIAFEPDPTSLAFLRRNLEANGCRNVRVEPKALSDKPGSVTLFCHKSNKGMHSLLQSEESEYEIEVEAVPLDAYLANQSRRIDLVKIDVEGAEGMVLDGMRETLATNPDMSIFLEFAPHRLAAAGYDPELLLGRLSQNGFKSYELDGPRIRRQAADARELLARMDRERLVYTNLLICGSHPSRGSR